MTSESPVYLKSFTAKNFKCFTRKLTMAMPSDGGYAGWHVILGDGGSGKTSLLQGIALARLGDAGESELNRLNRLNRLCGMSRRPTRLKARVQGKLADWFTVGYGASRRFTSKVDPLYPEPLNDRHETMFDEGARILCGESWVAHLYGSTLDKKLETRRSKVHSANLDVVMRVMGDLLALKGLRLASVDSRAVTLEGSSAPATQIRLSEIRDSGFAVVLNIVLDLMRRISEVASLEIDAQNRVRFAGTVLIDEVCAHLHPRWQREIGPLLCRVFPDLQFIVTTNSAFVAQSARPGGLFLLAADGSASTITQPVDSVQGMRSDQILTSPLFGLRSTRDLETERALQERDVLLDKETLSEEERARLEALEDWLSQQMSAPGDTFEEYKHYPKLQKLLSDDLDLMDET